MSLPFEGSEESPGTLLIHHAVVPAAIIAMVASLLFYLVDVRSAFLGGGPQLKWVGFCFVMGTVLIERYGRASSDAESQGWDRYETHALVHRKQQHHPRRVHHPQSVAFLLREEI